MKAACVGLGDDVQVKTLKFYVAFKRLKNFVTVEVRPSANTLLAYAKLDPDSVELEKGFTRDVRKIGHWGTGAADRLPGSGPQCQPKAGPRPWSVDVQ